MTGPDGHELATPTLMRAARGVYAQSIRAQLEAIGAGDLPRNGAALLAGIEMIRTGTTTFCEAGTLFDVPAVARAVDAVGLRAILGRWTWDLASGPGPLKQSTDEALQPLDLRADRRLSEIELLSRLGETAVSADRNERAQQNNGNIMSAAKLHHRVCRRHRTIVRPPTSA